LGTFNFKKSSKIHPKKSRARKTDTKSMKIDIFYEISFGFLNTIYRLHSPVTTMICPRNTQTPLLYTIIKVRSPANSGPGDGRYHVYTVGHVLHTDLYACCVPLYLSHAPSESAFGRLRSCDLKQKNTNCNEILVVFIHCDSKLSEFEAN
jgi:hypothetical protein